MLLRLAISNFMIAQQLTINFEKGMTAITGETGAGKSLTLDALSLLLGARSDSQMVRHGADRANLVAEFSLDNLPLVSKWLDENDYATTDHECIIQRAINKDGRSRATINGIPTNLQKLKELGALLIDMHSQHAHHKLLDKSHHETLIDSFGGLLSDTNKINKAYRQWQQSEQAYNGLKAKLNDADNRKEYLAFQLAEFEALCIQEGEYPQLEHQHKQLANAEAFQQGCLEALNLCRDSDVNILQQLKQAHQALLPFTELSDTLQNTLQLIESAQINIEEAMTDLTSLNHESAAAPEQLVSIEHRLSQFHDLARKHRTEPSELMALQLNLEAELEQLSQGDSDLNTLESQSKKYLAAYLEEASLLSQKRTFAAKKLENKIKKQLALLGMQNCQFNVGLTQDKHKPTSTGIDQVEFLVATNPGQIPAPLARIASGGELSRISLAIQVSIAEKSATPILVFDEVDVGIGGATAEVVGKLMRSLGEHTQIISITHQPQVASQANQHLKACKNQKKHSTDTAMTTLDDQGKITEIARMLGGVEITERTIEHAKEMLDIVS